MRRDCPAFKVICHTCDKVGHYSRVCRQKSRPDSPFQPGPGPDRKQVASVRVVKISACRSQEHPFSAPKVVLGVYHIRSPNLLGKVSGTPDSAAEATVTGPSFLRSLGISPHQLSPVRDVQFEVADKGIMKCLGSLRFTFKYGGRTFSDTVYICPDRDGLLLSWYLCRGLGILPENYPSPLPVHAVARGRDTHASVPVRPQDVESVVGPIPENPTADQRETIRTKLMDHFKDVFDSSSGLKVMKCPPMVIHLRENAVPFTARAPRQIAHAVRDKTRAALQELEDLKIITPVPDGEVSEWCHYLVCVLKPDGSVRCCVDLTKLNPFVVRPLHPLKTPKEAIGNINNDSKFFSVYDATKGYWQVELAEESQHLTTFITPWGRYKFLRATMGLVSAGDEFCRQGDIAMSGIGNTEKVVDDFIQFDLTFPQHVERVWQTLTRCREKCMTLNPKKFQFGLPEVSFCGYIVGTQGVKVDPAKIRAISDFPAPKNLTELRSFFGMINQLSHFSRDISSKAEPLRPLLSSKNEFVWTADHDKAFDEVKVALSISPTLVHFDVSKETRLSTDAARSRGLGFSLEQKHGEKWYLVECGSRFLSPTESRYATIELEMLGVVWATRKCQVYLQGLHRYEVVVDHKPLLPILNDYTLADIQNPRLQRLKEKLAGYVFLATWQPGKDHVVPDALSRSPVERPSQEDFDLEKDLGIFSAAAVRLNIQAVTIGNESPDPLIVSLVNQAEADTQYQDLVKAVETGFPDVKVAPHLVPYRKLRDNLSVTDGLVVLGNRIVVPRAARSGVLENLHASHQGVERTKRRARQCVYWPGINSDVVNKLQGCQACQERLPSLCKEPLMADPPPEWVFQHVSADLFEYASRHFLVYTDHLSGWPVVYSFGKAVPSARHIIKAFRLFFADLGAPQKLRCDNGPQFAASEFRKFLTHWNVTWAPSTPHYPQSNGRAEAAVKSMKAIVAKATQNGELDNDSYIAAILEYRNTPSESGYSPAQILFGHSLRSHVPAHRNLFSQEWADKADALKKEKLSALKEKAKTFYNRGSHSHAQLNLGQTVRIQDHATRRWDRSGKITGVGRYRDYRVTLPSGRVFWRNRRFLRLAYANEEIPTPKEERKEENRENKPCPKPILKKAESNEDISLKKSVTFKQDLRRSSRQKKPPRKYSPS